MSAPYRTLNSCHRQLPNNWRENIQEALRQEHHVSRPASPTPDVDAKPDVIDVTSSRSKPANKGLRGEKALPKVGVNLLFSSAGFSFHCA